MAFDFSNYLLSVSDNAAGCITDWSSEPHKLSNTENGRYKDERACAKLRGSQPKGNWKGKRESSSGNQSNDSEIFADRDNDDDVFDKVSSRNSPNEATLQNGRVKLEQGIQAWQTVSHETLSWNDKLKWLSKNQLRIEDARSASFPAEDLRKLLQRLKTTPKTSPSGMNSPDSRELVRRDPDGQDPDRPTLRQLAYRSRKSLPDRLTNDHVTPAKHEARRKFSRRGSVKFADEFGLNLNTFVMIPSRFNTQARDDVIWHLPQDNRKLNIDGRISAYVHRNTAMNGFIGMGSRWNLAKDAGLFPSEEVDDGNFWPGWDSLEFRSNRKLAEDDFRNASNHRRFSWVKRSSEPEIQKPEEAVLQVAKPEAEVNGQLHEFRLCFEQPFADLDDFQRKLHENLLCLENVRVDDRHSRSGDEDFGGTAPLRSWQGTTVLCSIKVRHTNGGGPRTVFARCTDNDWTTYADLPAQHLEGVANLGYEYDTFCFAVRKPVQPPREEMMEDVSSGIRSAVEFALCCRVTTDGGIMNYWDNNGGVNYRIEWFDN